MTRWSPPERPMERPTRRPRDRATRRQLLVSLVGGEALDAVVPAALAIVERDPLATAACFPGDLLRGLMEVPGSFWGPNGALYARYQAVVRAGAAARRHLSLEQRMAFWEPLDLDAVARRSTCRTALVAERDPAVRAMVARTLQLLGYATVAAADGDEALALADRHTGSLALCVVAIPTLEPGSPALARTVRTLPPRAPVIFISGERAPRALSDLVVGRPAAFVPKPFSAEELSRAVRELTA